MRRAENPYLPHVPAPSRGSGSWPAGNVSAATLPAIPEIDTEVHAKITHNAPRSAEGIIHEFKLLCARGGTARRDERLSAWQFRGGRERQRVGGQAEACRQGRRGE